jgi:hypothetical protein
MEPDDALADHVDNAIDDLVDDMVARFIERQIHLMKDRVVARAKERLVLSLTDRIMKRARRRKPEPRFPEPSTLTSTTQPPSNGSRSARGSRKLSVAVMPRAASSSTS